MWVKLNTIQHLPDPDQGGKLRTYRPGDWVQIKNKALIRRLLAEGAAEVDKPEGWLARKFIPQGSGVLWVSEPGDLGGYGSSLGESPSDLPHLPFSYNIYWDTSLSLQHKYIPLGLGRLEKWQIAIPFLPYHMLASKLGSEAEREETEKVVGDLRVLTYDTRLIFIKRDPLTVRLMGLWVEEQNEHRNKALAFLRAIHRITPKPLLCALPVEWAQRVSGR